VMSVSDTLRELLAAATEDDVIRVAEQWSLTEELRMAGVDAQAAAGVLAALAGLARRARAADMHLYCQWTL